MAEVKKQNVFKRFFGAIGRYLRELRSELKKVVWPTPKQVIKNTGIVFACVILIGLFIWILDPVATVARDALIDLFHG